MYYYYYYYYYFILLAILKENVGFTISFRNAA